MDITGHFQKSADIRRILSESHFGAVLSSQKICKKIACIALILAFISAILVFRGSIDDFAPKHISAILEVVAQGHLFSNSMVDSALGYYVYGAEIISLLGITGSELLFFPIQIIPFIIIIFATYYYFSKNLLFSSAIVLIQVFMHYTGSMVVFFWPHGLGSILFYTILLALMCFFKNIGHNRLQFTFVLIILGTSLNFMSYNNAFNVMLLLCFFLFLAFANLLSDSRYGSSGLWGQHYWRYLVFFLIVMSIVQLGLSNFFYEPFLSALEHAGGSLSIFDKLLVKFWGPEMISSPFSDILVSYPRILSYFSIVRSFFIFSSIFIFIFILYKYVFRQRELNFQDILCIVLLLMSASMAIVRASIGAGFVPHFYLPGFFCAAWIIASKLNYRYFSYLFLIALLLISPLSVHEMRANNLFDSDSGKYQKFEQPSIWHARYLASDFSYSDEFTRNMFSLKQNEMRVYSETSVNTVGILPFDETLFLIRDKPSMLDSAYYIINYDKNIMSLQNWRYIKSWRYFSINLLNNRDLNSIYDAGFISIYSKVGETM